MMIHAYQEMYLSRAQSVLGDAFDYAINKCRIPGAEFTDMFIVSSVSKRMENGEPACLTGRSGIETVADILWEIKGSELLVESEQQYARSREYWIGWAIAYYQWYSDRKYRDIFNCISYDELARMYHTLHEADIHKFVDAVEARIRECAPETNLKRVRTQCKITQVQLAEQSGVSLRSIQMYEQRNKNINKAGLETVYRLAKTLHTTMEALLEHSDIE